MKKIALASAAMGGVALITFGASGTFAAFQDTETGTATASAGTMDLSVGGGAQTSTVPALGLNPGQTTTMSYWVSNTGTTAGNLTAVLSVTDEERGCTEPEKEAGDTTTCGWGDGGEFSEFATVQFFDAAANTAESCKQAVGGTEVTPALTLRQAAAAPAQSVGSLGNNAGNCYVVAIQLPLGTGGANNVVQGDVSAIGVKLNLVQV